MSTKNLESPSPIISTLPLVGETYNYFDDGKIKRSRMSNVTIKEIIPFDKVDAKLLKEWSEEVGECDWLYNKETDFFIKAELKMNNKHNDDIVFVRMVDNQGWFSLGFWGGSLDIDGSLYKKME